MTTQQWRTTPGVAQRPDIIPAAQTLPPRFTGAAARRIAFGTRLAADAVAVFAALLAADAMQRNLPGGLSGPFEAFEVCVAVTLVTWLSLSALLGLYDERRLTNTFDEFKLVLQSAAVGSVAATFVATMMEDSAPRSWVLLLWGAASVSGLAMRVVHRLALRRMRATRTIGTRMLIIGAGVEARELHDQVTRNTHRLGYDVLGFLDDDRVAGPVGPDYPEIIGGVDEVRELVLELDVDEVLVARNAVSEATAERVYRDIQGLKVNLHVSTGLLGVAANRVKVQRFGTAPVFALQRVDLSGFQQTLKRAFDLVVAGTAVLALSPLLAVCALAVKLSGPGPVLFSQRRVGRDGNEFTIHKFRSMVVDAEARLEELRDRNEADGLLFKLADDPRVTKVGKFMRAWSLDELPQLLDVIRGDMSLVGPRPPLPSEVAAYDDWLRNRLRVKPGLTGLWQVSGRHQASFADYVRHDLFYVEDWSLAMDLFIVLRTIPAVLARSGA